MADIEKLSKQIDELKTNIDDAKDERNRLQGRFDESMQKLKDDFNCDSIESAKEKLETFTNRRDSLTKELEEKVTELEDACTWNA